MKLTNPYFKYAVKLLPHKDKRHKGGEDAYVAQDNLIAVADGVGGWGEVGVDPALFSKELCSNIKKIFDENPKESLKEVLVSAVKLQTFKGSSTAVLAKFDQENPGNILTTNLGDSGYLLCHVEYDGKGEPKLE